MPILLMKCAKCGAEARSHNGKWYTCVACGSITSIKPECQECQRLHPEKECAQEKCYNEQCPVFKKQAYLG